RVKGSHVRGALGNGEGALTLRINTGRRERTRGHDRTQTGQDDGRQEWTFTIPLRSGRGNPGSHLRPRILAKCVRRASVGCAYPDGREKAALTVNAFLRLSAV